MLLNSINPYTAQVIKSYTPFSEQETDQAVRAAYLAWQEWKMTPFTIRAELLEKTAGILRQRKHSLAVLMAEEMGKPLKDGIAEIEKCASVCEYYAANGADLLRDETIRTDASKSYVTFQPLGVVLAVMPWNFPFWQVFRFLAPALMAGNAAVLKHASNVQGCAFEIQTILEMAGFPENLLRNLSIGSDEVEKVIGNPLVKAVTLTGSTEAGKKVAEKAGSLIKRTVLELGGSDAYIIMEDADLELAAEVCASSRLINGGQSCIAAKRFIVNEKIAQEFTTRLFDKMNTRIMGSPLDEQTDIGPLARVDLRDQLHEQVQKSVEAGAECILGGYVPEGPGAFYPPTILTNVRKGMPAYDEELFGPVAAVITAKDEFEALFIANDTNFGLGGAIFSADLTRAEELAARFLEAGSCFVNALVRSDPRLPFGGINESGYGRELGSYGIKEFVNIKTVYIR